MRSHRNGDTYTFEIDLNMARAISAIAMCQYWTSGLLVRICKGRASAAINPPTAQLLPLGTHSEYWHDTGFTAQADFVDANTLHHGGMILRRKLAAP
jgi:Agrobacterium tumefaciens protein Atu4866.